MDKNQFDAFKIFCDDYKKKCEEWSALSSSLIPLQKRAAKDDTPDYPIQTPVVYNKALDQIQEDDQIKIIVIGDNPGKDEQLAVNNKYLVGQAGKIAEGFFKRHPSLGIDFRKNAIILNKTPVHSAKTKHLKFIAAQNAAARDLILQSQLWLAKKTAWLSEKIAAQIWLVGYAELKDKGIFAPYRDQLKKAAQEESGAAWENLFVFQHFSMNRFLIDLRDFCAKEGGLDPSGGFDESALAKKIAALGKRHRDEIFG
ncbi:MAG: hypothetical protein K6A42_08405 [Treponema sp.]|nr:hypothetical protein [Treponema sp.]